MKILNYDAPEELVIKVLEQAIPDFILEVIRKQETAFYHGDEFYLQVLCPLQRYEQGEESEEFTPISFDQGLRPTPIRKFTRASYRNIVSLLHTIPVYLREKNTKGDEDGDLLGTYYPDTNNPYIELYMQDIWDAAKANDLHYKWLLTKVLIHELAHAALDVYNLENGEYIEKVEYSPANRELMREFGKWREESMANAITLRIIREADDTAFYAYAKEYMLHQPDKYALGVWLENFEDLDFDSVLEAKYMRVPVDFAEEWMEYVQGTPDWEGLHQRNKELIGEWAKKQKNNSKEFSNC